MVSAKFKKIEKLCEEKTDGHLEEVTKEVDIIAREVNLIMDEIAKIKKQYQT